MHSASRWFLTLFFWLLISSTWGWVSCRDGTIENGLKNNHRAFVLPAKAPSKASINDSNDSDVSDDNVEYGGCTSEVVGAFGRMGSFWLCHPSPTTSYAAAIPRGLSPGCLSPPGCPILINTPSSAWESIFSQTPAARKQDLVFVGNGIPSPKFQDCTVVVPHYSILQICQKSTAHSPIGTNPLSPSTFVYGKHAAYTARILQEHGVQTELVDSFASIQSKAALKLFWASCMWLICHSSTITNDNDGGPAYTFEEVIQNHQAKLDRLVDDLLTSLKEHLGHPVSRSEVQDYMRSYSLSIPKAIPSKELAIKELEDRNGFWLKLRTENNPQLFHQELIESVLGKEKLKQLLLRSGSSLGANEDDSLVPGGGKEEEELVVNLDEIGLQLSGKASSVVSNSTDDAPPPPPIQRIVVVGAGILGSSTAYFLKLQNPNLDIHVIDLLGAKDLGKTTPASWAWLNANGKEPKEYQILNQLGLHAWKHCKTVCHLPSWSGSLVRFAAPPTFVNEGGYPCEGPITMERVLDLEPFANWQVSKNDSRDDDSSEQGVTYYFPGEGFVDPAQVVKTFRDEAARLGVTFDSNQNVTAIVRNEDGSVCGVECTNSSAFEDGSTATTSFRPADLVVVAAGIGAAAKALGNLPLKYEPGTIVHAKTTSTEPSPPRLSRILVDTMRSSHVLQRSDGSIVAGGGALAVGGSTGMVQSSLVKNNKESLSMFEAAKQLSPIVVGNSEPMHFAEAVRPMPKDGLPAVGFLQEGIYTVVTHSGMTLGPLLASMAAAEITKKVSIHLLEPFRPTRFFVNDERSE
ncbi:unnamed protein product [Cylindrotheca closterium]|uniref:FAD dependent oxidoreductase domain-containing protein n=1 Tax=Cylindrotheca closterium TaxID=2856 RepID=A0AAD2CBK9_9STRA|nr:unnamed protein product [Cylindrotheca closterium]